MERFNAPWVDVNDQMPERMVRVRLFLVHRSGTTGHYCESYVYARKNKPDRWRFENYDMTRQGWTPVAWMPLPDCVELCDTDATPCKVIWPPS